jgi:adenylate kinase family enzyme
MKKVLVVGSTGAGKSTLARALAEKHGLTYTDLDYLYHLPGWQQRPEAEFRALVDEATRGEKWVIAGNYYSLVGDITWSRADTVVWLDLPFAQNFSQLLKRTIKRARTGELICNGNTETLHKQFLTCDSILWWLIKTWHKNRRRYGDIFGHPEKYPHLSFIRLISTQEVQSLVG